MKNSIHLFQVMALTSLSLVMLDGCAQNPSSISTEEKSKENYSRIKFQLDSCNMRIVIPVKLNDSLTAQMMFDCGSMKGTFMLNSAYLASKPNFKFNVPPLNANTGSAISRSRVKNLVYKTMLPIKIGSADLMFLR